MRIPILLFLGLLILLGALFYSFLPRRRTMYRSLKWTQEAGRIPTGHQESAGGHSTRMAKGGGKLRLHEAGSLYRQAAFCRRASDLEGRIAWLLRLLDGPASLPKTPAPLTPFGLRLEDVSDATLKELAHLSNLQILMIPSVPASAIMG